MGWKGRKKFTEYLVLVFLNYWGFPFLQQGFPSIGIYLPFFGAACGYLARVVHMACHLLVTKESNEQVLFSAWQLPF